MREERFNPWRASMVLGALFVMIHFGTKPGPDWFDAVIVVVWLWIGGVNLSIFMRGRE